jgi:hypothetical protein
MLIIGQAHWVNIPGVCHQHHGPRTLSHPPCPLRPCCRVMTVPCPMMTTSTPSIVRRMRTTSETTSTATGKEEEDVDKKYFPPTPPGKDFPCPPATPAIATVLAVAPHDGRGIVAAAAAGGALPLKRPLPHQVQRCGVEHPPIKAQVLPPPWP